MYIPKVSILMTVRNGERFIETALQSSLKQTFAELELVIVDDGSTDNSMEVVRRSSDPRVMVVQTDGIGRTPALNKGLAYARGTYVAVLDADDIALPKRLERQVAFLDANPTVALAGTACIFIDDKGLELEAFSPPTSFHEILKAMPIYNPFAHSSVMYRKQAAIDVGGYPTDFAYAQDFGLYLLLINTHELANLPDCLTHIRRHANQMTCSAEYSDDLLRDGGILLAKARKIPGLPIDVVNLGRKCNAWMDLEYLRRLRERGEWKRAIHYVLARCVLEPLEPETWRLIKSLLTGKDFHRKT